jgi:AcrR family transcriptional regulator
MSEWTGRADDGMNGQATDMPRQTHRPVVEMQRAWIFEAMVSISCERGFASTSVTALCSHARVSRRTFYTMFENREECFLEVLDEGCRQVGMLISGALENAQRWQDGVRAALVALLSFFDSEPGLTRLWFVESLSAGAWALERRERNLAALTRLIVERWPMPPGVNAHPLAAVGVMAAVIGVIQTHLVTAKPEALITLLGPLMGLATTPYADAATVAAEIRRGEALAQAMIAGSSSQQGPEPQAERPAVTPAALRDPRAYRARLSLLYLAKHPGASNRQIADGIGIPHQAQISKLLTRLARNGLVTKQPTRPGHANSWSLTEHGLRMSRSYEQSGAVTPVGQTTPSDL